MLKILKNKRHNREKRLFTTSPCELLLLEAREARKICIDAIHRLQQSAPEATRENEEEDEIIDRNNNVMHGYNEKNIALALKIIPVLLKLHEHELYLLREEEAIRAENKSHAGNAEYFPPLSEVDLVILRQALEKSGLPAGTEG